MGILRMIIYTQNLCRYSEFLHRTEANFPNKKSRGSAHRPFARPSPVAVAISGDNFLVPRARMICAPNLRVADSIKRRQTDRLKEQSESATPSYICCMAR